MAREAHLLGVFHRLRQYDPLDGPQTLQWICIDASHNCNMIHDWEILLSHAVLHCDALGRFELLLSHCKLTRLYRNCFTRRATSASLHTLKLDLSNNNLEEIGLSQFLFIADSGIHSLDLDLSYNRVSSKGAKVLCRLRKASRLICLKLLLRGNRVTVNAVDDLALLLQPMLSAPSRHVHLDLRQNLLSLADQQMLLHRQNVGLQKTSGWFSGSIVLLTK